MARKYLTLAGRGAAERVVRDSRHGPRILLECERSGFQGAPALTYFAALLCYRLGDTSTVPLAKGLKTHEAELIRTRAYETAREIRP